MAAMRRFGKIRDFCRDFYGENNAILFDLDGTLWDALADHPRLERGDEGENASRFFLAKPRSNPSWD
jgi:FMN phosphatase YigB (HAD superfamily)